MGQYSIKNLPKPFCQCLLCETGKDEAPEEKKCEFEIKTTSKIGTRNGASSK